MLFNVFDQFDRTKKQGAVQAMDLNAGRVPRQFGVLRLANGFGAAQAGDAVDERQTSRHQADLDSNRQIHHHGEQKHRQQRDAVGHAELAQMHKLTPFAHVPSHKHQNRRQSSQGHMPCQGRSQRPTQKNEKNIEKDLPEGAHAGKTNTSQPPRPSLTLIS